MYILCHIVGFLCILYIYKDKFTLFSKDLTKLACGGDDVLLLGYVLDGTDDLLDDDTYDLLDGNYSITY